MSSNDNDIENAYKQMFADTAPASEQEGVAASRSLADDLIDAVGVPVEVRPRLTCPKCSSTDFDVRSSLGSTVINVCVKCYTKVYSKKKAFVSPVPTHSQGTGKGPFYSSTPKREPPSKYTPKYKLKSKPRKKND